MDKKEANSILVEHLARYRTRSYAELATWVRDGRVDTPEAVGPSGTNYQIEIELFSNMGTGTLFGHQNL